MGEYARTKCRRYYARAPRAAGDREMPRMGFTASQAGPAGPAEAVIVIDDDDFSDDGGLH
jgi:hypothetical protein